MGDLNWTDDQWRKVKDAVTEAFGKASVASAVLPLYGPLSGGAETVRNERLDSTTAATIKLTSDHPDVNEKLLNVTVKVELSSEQVSDEGLSNALFAFRRAAIILAQEEDRIVFEGFDANTSKSKDYVTNKGQNEVRKGLADPVVRLAVPDIPKKKPIDPKDPTKGDWPLGALLVSAVVQAIQKLENNANSGPFTCVLGDNLFVAAQEPSSFSLVLPSDRIVPILKGPLLRCGQMDRDTGIVLALANGGIDVVVGTPPTVQFLQRTPEAKFLFRVYTRFALRVRDVTKPPIAGFKAS